MLWYKAWLETRSRFLISLFGITAICSDTVFHLDKGLPGGLNNAYYYSALHNGHSQLVMLWLVAVNLLAMGGLLREQALGTASFTLALPVGRARLVGVRIGVILMEAMLLILIPTSAMVLTGSIFGPIYSISQCLFSMALLTGGGLLFGAVALLASSFVEGEYTAPIVSFGFVIPDLCTPAGFSAEADLKPNHLRTPLSLGET